jgi:hypothetical protein
MPKAELHLHIEGAIPVPTLWELIEHHGGDPVIKSPEQLVDFYTYRDFAHFMETWVWMNTFLRTYDDFEFAAEAVARHLLEHAPTTTSSSPPRRLPVISSNRTSCMPRPSSLQPTFAATV